MKTLELVSRMIGERSSEELSFILWEFTCYPFGSVLQVARNLRKYKKLEGLGLTPCFWCGEGFIPGMGGEFTDCCSKCDQNKPWLIKEESECLN